MVCCILGNDIFYQASHCVDMSVLFPVGVVCCVLGNDIFYQASHCVDMSVLFPVGLCVVF